MYLVFMKEICLVHNLGDSLYFVILGPAEYFFYRFIVPTSHEWVAY